MASYTTRKRIIREWVEIKGKRTVCFRERYIKKRKSVRFKRVFGNSDVCSVEGKKFLHLRREQDAGRLNKHTMRKLSSIYGVLF